MEKCRKKPLIGLTPSHNTENDDIRMTPTYLRALRAAGAIPLVLPLEVSQEDLSRLTDTLDGFLFTGGPDVHPFLFGEDTHAHCGNVSPLRDNMELALLPLVMKAKKPILGICRGIQLINIGLGGTIYQDLTSQWKETFPVAHSQPFDYHTPSHTVMVRPGTRLASLTGLLNGGTIRVNSMHHQAVKDAAVGLSVSATASGGLVEALEMPDYPYLLAVQWHPEYLWERDCSAAALFKDFVNACS